MILKQGGTFTRMFFLGSTGLTPNVEISKAGAAFAAPTNTIAELSDGWYTLALVAGDLDTPGQLAYHFDAGTPADFEDEVAPQWFGDDLKANVQKWLDAPVTLQAGSTPNVFVVGLADNAVNVFSFADSACQKVWQSVALNEAYAADGANAKPHELLYMIWSALSEFQISGSTLTCKKLDGTTTSMQFTLSPAGDPTSRARSA